ncbi:MAG: excinuclease ABC subunit UvrC [Dehalococcoidia bacterium]|nr:MAG: excinuclease ABC subunit UvrC [Dehalococcoidia bacterium]
MVNSNIESYLNLLPHKPGIYIFRDQTGKVIYVGKASNLYNRVRSYFKQIHNTSDKTAQLVNNIDKIEYVVTESEIAALLLESQQIKKYRPFFNILLKDDKSFPYIKVDVKNDWPTISITRRRYNDGAKYIGRIPSAWSARQTYEYIRKIFPLRSCNKVLDGKASRPCLKFHIKRCQGPCIGAISTDDYQLLVKRTVALLEGKEDQVIRDLKIEMEGASARLEFEKAAQIRNQLQAIKAVIESNKIPLNIRGEQDVIGIARDQDLACIRIFSVKDSRLMHDEHFIVERASGETDENLLESFIKQYYLSAEHIPGQIWLHTPIDESQLIKQWLSGIRGGQVTIRVPHKGAGLRLVQMVIENAKQQLDIYQSRKASRPESLKVLTNLKEILKLEQVPHRIEAYDISNIQGTSAVGSMVVFENGVSKPSYYRRFKIRQVDHTDDYAMMSEVMRRRFGKHDADDKKWSVLPGLVLIDGGKGHLKAALTAMKAVGAGNVPVISIAKENEDIFQPGIPHPAPLDKSSEELHLLQRIRDESHRFAVTYHRQLRSKKGKESALDSISGVGPARKKALIRKFGSVSNLRTAAVEDLTEVKGITPSLARRILEELG